MDLQFTNAQLALQKRAKEFAAQEMLPVVDKLEEDLNLRQQLFVKMAQAGFFDLSLSKDYLGYMLALFEIAKVDAGLSVARSIINIVIEATQTYGTKEQQDKYLRAVKSGAGVPLSFALTEKDSGSDAKSIHATASIKNGKVILNGCKQFITNADMAAAILVFTKTDPEKGTKGISAFLLDKETKGFKVVKKERKLGLLSANLIDLELQNCEIAESQMLGKVGQGFEIAMHALEGGRIGISAQALGIAEAAYEAALDYSKTRIQFDHSLADNQVIAFRLADMYIKLSAGKNLLYQACFLKSRGEDVNLAASVAKVYCTEAANEIVNEALEIFGGYGYIKDNPIERYFRDVRATTLYEGTSEIQCMIISKMILKRR